MFVLNNVTSRARLALLGFYEEVVRVGIWLDRKYSNKPNTVIAATRVAGRTVIECWTTCGSIGWLVRAIPLGCPTAQVRGQVLLADTECIVIHNAAYLMFKEAVTPRLLNAVGAAVVCPTRSRIALESGTATCSTACGTAHSMVLLDRNDSILAKGWSGW
jgi:hypothetical protein